MRSLVLLVALAFITPHVVAAQVVFNTLSEPYATFELPTDVPRVQTAYGSLRGNPDTYAFTITATTTMAVRLATPDVAAPNPDFSGILVADEGGRGVREIMRLPAAQLVWTPYQDPQTKMRYQQSVPREAELPPGAYRIEVSTPNNEGKYRLLVATTESNPYQYSWSDVRDIHAWHEVGWWHMLRTSVVHTPLLFAVVALGLLGTWWYARRRNLV